MLPKKYLYNRKGVITDIFPNGSAEIAFELDGVQAHTFLKKGRYYHRGRLVPENTLIDKYVRIGTKVKFSCHPLDRADVKTESFSHFHRWYDWYAIMCWTDLDDEPDTQISLSSGLYSVLCTIESVKKRHAVMTTLESSTTEHRIELLASKFYVHLKRFPASRSLSAALNIDDTLFSDAVPCIREESRSDCEWFATCAFQGKRPNLPEPSDLLNILCSNHVSENSQNTLQNDNKELYGDSSDQSVPCAQVKARVKSELPQEINLYTRNPRTIFTTGYGFILDVLNDEYAILLGCFKRNVFQTILFHRGNAFLFKSSLSRCKLSEIFEEGDRLRFIAVGAPPNFFTDWIAVQVSVAEDVPQGEDSRQP